MSNQWLIWWMGLCAAAAVNAVAWGVSARALARREEFLPAEVCATRRKLLWLSLVYVVGCGFRSGFPMVDVPRICLHDTWVARIVVGRTIATVAELSFAVQWSLLLREAGASARSTLATTASWILVPLILTAQLSCWIAVLTTNYLPHAVENSLWTLAALLATVGFASAAPHLDEKSRRFIRAVLVCGAAYVAFMAIVDVPMYLSRWHADLLSGHQSLTLFEGMRDILARCTVKRDWMAWREDMVWLSLYFTLAVWTSIALAHVPPLRRAG